MKKRFEINSTERKKIIFESPQINDDGWIQQYRLIFESTRLNANMEIYNQPYGVLLNEYFSDLADHWDGWEGVKSWESIEGEFTIETSMNSSGHASMKISMNVYGSPSDWVAIADLDVEAGQLEKIANDAKQFLNQ